MREVPAWVARQPFASMRGNWGAEPRGALCEHAVQCAPVGATLVPGAGAAPCFSGIVIRFTRALDAFSRGSATGQARAKPGEGGLRDPAWPYSAPQYWQLANSHGSRSPAGLHSEPNTAAFARVMRVSHLYLKK